MPFMVIYRTSDGVSRFEQAGAIDEAALFVERLRNKDGIDQIRIYRMEEIGFAFRPYYKVELGAPDRERPAAQAEVASLVTVVDSAERPTESSDAPEPAEEADGAAPGNPPGPQHAAPEPERAGSNGRQGLFGR